MSSYSVTEIAAKTVTLAALLLAIVFGLGVVWRVEKKLDLSFKFFLLAILAFFASELQGFLYSYDSRVFGLVSVFLKFSVALFFLLGMATMRNMIRRIDGEK